jgi:DNA replication protein DnaC
MKGEMGEVRTALVENLKELHLPVMRGCFEETARRAEKKTLSYERYLLELAQRECEEQRRKRIGKLLKESGLPLEKSLANFDGKRLPVKVSRQMKVLLEGGFLDRKENLLIFGNPGAGKSHLLCALAQELIAVRGRKIRYATCPLLVQDLLAAKRDLRLGKEIKKLANYDGLIIDEMGYVQQSREEMEVVFTLLAERYERGSVAADEQPAIFEMGRHFQRSDNHRGRDRSPGPSLRNFGTQHPESPHGASQEESGRGFGVRRSKVTIDDFFNSANAAAELWKKPGRGKRGKPKAGFPPFPPPLEIPQNPRDSTFPTAPTAAGISNNIGKSNCR